MKRKKMDDTEIMVKGIDALNDSLGVMGALRFLTKLNRDPTDYVEISRTLYKGQTMDEIFARAKGSKRQP
jgi:hypothetical protein